MSGKTVKTIAYTVVAVVIFSATAVYFLWNKKHRDVAGTDGIKIEAGVLYKNFTADAVVANKNYVQQVLQVAGTVSSISKNQQGNTVALLKTTADGAYINCTMEQAVVDVKQGTNVLIKGICNGLGQGDAELGILGDVYLVRCYLVK